MRRRVWTAGLLLAGPASASLALGCGLLRGPGAAGTLPETSQSRSALGTTLEITVRDGERLRARRAIAAAFAEVERLEGLLSEWRSFSEISALNRAAGRDWITLSEETVEALEAALALAALSEGAFDPTVLPLLRAWGFVGAEPRVPGEGELARLRRRVGWRRIQVDPARDRVRIPRGTSVSLGGILQGFVADRCLALLRDAGVPAAMVATPGNRAFYGGTEGQPWQLAVEDPERPGGPIARFSRRDGALSTSAPAFRAFEAGGERFHHLLDPRTGRPARSELRQVTVVAPTGTLADGLSTAIFVRGREGLVWIQGQQDVGVVALFRNGRRHASQALDVTWSQPD